MATKESLVSVIHDTGYGPDLLYHMNVAMGGKDMRADKLVKDPLVKTAPKLLQTLKALCDNRVLRNHPAVEMNALEVIAEAEGRDTNRRGGGK